MIQSERLCVRQNLIVDLKTQPNIRKVHSIASYTNMYGPVNFL
jgi:hypothetical protein